MRIFFRLIINYHWIQLKKIMIFNSNLYLNDKRNIIIVLLLKNGKEFLKKLFT